MKKFVDSLSYISFGCNESRDVVRVFLGMKVNFGKHSETVQLSGEGKTVSEAVSHCLQAKFSSDWGGIAEGFKWEIVSRWFDSALTRTKHADKRVGAFEEVISHLNSAIQLGRLSYDKSEAERFEDASTVVHQEGRVNSWANVS